ncbi:hypothetical protein BOTNAR_0080g00300 [Botryotinia narcissicola]|uniref:Uncharacterized protein n=1 Tax=Botryotinia narcissicola TaxID=278944 RepID=A0A4Z1J8E3_9HELO|nr:hypothetical protein BOTNAR_0080g00300 [Botryotinia narcissicola]
MFKVSYVSTRTNRDEGGRKEERKKTKEDIGFFQGIAHTKHFRFYCKVSSRVRIARDIDSSQIKSDAGDNGVV